MCFIWACKIYDLLLDEVEVCPVDVSVVSVPLDVLELVVVCALLELVVEVSELEL